MNKRNTPKRATKAYAVGIPFQGAELDGFRSHCRSYGYHQGAFVRIAVLEKIELEKRIRREATA